MQYNKTDDSEKLIKNTYETESTICGIRKVYKDSNRWSVVIPLLIRHKSIYNKGIELYMACDKSVSTIFAADSPYKLKDFVEENTRTRRRKIGKTDSRITVPDNNIEPDIFGDINNVAVEWHKEYDILRFRPALIEDMHEIKYASRKRKRNRES